MSDQGLAVEKDAACDCECGRLMFPHRYSAKACLCIECGDHRGWTVRPDWNTGDAVQVQCRACTEHECPTVMASDICHNGHPFEPGVTVDDSPGESHPDWCNVCGEARVTASGEGRA